MPFNTSSFLPKRFVFERGRGPELPEARGEVLERDDVGGTVVEAQRIISDFGPTTENNFATLRDKINRSGLPADARNKFLKDIEGLEGGSVEEQIKYASGLGKKLRAHASDLGTKIGKGRMNTEAFDGLEKAVEGLQAENLRAKIQEEETKISVGQGVISVAEYATAPFAVLLRVAANVIGLAIGNVIRAITVAVRTAVKK